VITGSPFGFTAVLGIISLIGVIVSHVIVLFDLIEEMQERGEPLREALVDAGLIGCRPVLITVGATIFGLLPLANPRWRALGAALLRADWRARLRHHDHAGPGSGPLRDLRRRPPHRPLARRRRRRAARAGRRGPYRRSREMTLLLSAWRTLALTSVAVFVVSLDGTVLFVAFPAIRATSRTSPPPSSPGSSTRTPSCSGALLVPAGRIADRVGRKRIFLLGLGLFSAALRALRAWHPRPAC